MNRLRFWTILAFLSVVAVAAVLFTSRHKPPFPFLAQMKLVSTSVRPDITSGRLRRVEMYRTPKTFKEILAIADAEVATRQGWILSGKDDSPGWSEYHGSSESIEFIDDEPLQFEVKPLGVTWMPETGGKGSMRTIIYTAPAGSWDEFRYKAGRALDRLLGGA